VEATAKGLELECANLFWALPYTLACTANSVTWLIGRDSTDIDRLQAITKWEEDVILGYEDSLAFIALKCELLGF